MTKYEQIAELEWSQLTDIMHHFFYSDCRSWQAEILDEITDDDDRIFIMVRDMIVEKICKEVSCKELQEYGYNITEDIEEAA